VADDEAFVADFTLAERDPVDPLPRDLRANIARRLLERAGFEVHPAEAPVRVADPGAIAAVRNKG
jgi:hypothetical protein